MIDNTGHCSCVSFYGGTFNSHTLSMAYQYLIEWISSLGLTPTHMSATGKGFSGRQLSFDSLDKRLKKQHFNVQSYNIAVIDSREYPKSIKYVPKYLVRTELWPRDASGVLICQTKEQSFDRNVFGMPAIEYIKTLSPAYGYGFYLPYRWGPANYAMGAGTMPPDFVAEESSTLDRYASEANRWYRKGRMPKAYLQGLLRDVFPWNFLTAPQLDRPIDGEPLRNWIMKESWRGTLKPIDERIMLWDVEVGNIPRIREILLLHGNIIQ